MQIDRSNALTATSAQHKRLSNASEIVKQLLALAEGRGASVGAQTLEVYVEDLGDCDLRDLQKACAKIRRAERVDGETAFPTVGKILVEVKEAKRIRDIAELRFVPRPEVAAALLRDAEIKRMLASGERMEFILDAGEEPMLKALGDKCSMD